MKIKEIKLHALLNIGPYSHVTMDLSGDLESGDDYNKILKEFKGIANQTLNDLTVVMEQAKVEEVQDPKVGQSSAEEPKKEKKTRAKKTETPVEESVVEEPKKEKVNKKHTLYSDDNKHILQTYLGKKYGDSWKTVKPKPEIIAFTSNLKGMEFLDEKGEILESFLNHIHKFFDN